MNLSNKNREKYIVTIKKILMNLSNKKERNILLQ